MRSSLSATARRSSSSADATWHPASPSSSSFWHGETKKGGGGKRKGALHWVSRHRLAPTLHTTLAARACQVEAWELVLLVGVFSSLALANEVS